MGHNHNNVPDNAMVQNRLCSIVNSSVLLISESHLMALVVQLVDRVALVPLLDTVVEGEGK